MDGQPEVFRRDVRSVREQILQTRQDLAAAKQAKNGEKEIILSELLLSLYKQLLTLHEEQNSLLHSQAPGRHCLELVLAYLCFHHVALHSVNDSVFVLGAIHDPKGLLSRLPQTQGCTLYAVCM